MLNGVKVLQLANLLPGPLAAKMLQTLGAEVTTIEPLKLGGDPIKQYRFIQPKQQQNNIPSTNYNNFNITTTTGELMYQALNKGKKVHLMDFHDNEDLKNTSSNSSSSSIDLFHKLCQESDVLIYSLKPDALEKQRMTPLDLRKQHPHLIIACITGYGLFNNYGSDGGNKNNKNKWCTRPGHDINYLARSGVLAVASQQSIFRDSVRDGTGFLVSYDDPILKPQVVQIADIAGGCYPAVTQILAALFRKERMMTRQQRQLRDNTNHNENLVVANDDCGGVGALIDVSMTACSRSLSILQETVRHDLTAQNPKLEKDFCEGGNFILSGAAPCYRFYPTKDDEGRLLAVGCLELPYGLKFMKVILKYCFIEDDDPVLRECIERYMNPKTAKLFQFANVTEVNMKFESDKNDSGDVSAVEVIATISNCTRRLTHSEWREILNQEENYCMVDAVLNGKEAQQEEEEEKMRKSKLTQGNHDDKSEEVDKLWTEFHVPNPFRFL